MPTNLACPEVMQWRLYLSGEMAEAQADALEQHGLMCPRCAEVLERLTGEDELVSVIRTAENTETSSEHTEVEALIERLQSWLPGMVMRSLDTPSSVLEETPHAMHAPLEVGEILAPAEDLD